MNEYYLQLNRVEGVLKTTQRTRDGKWVFHKNGLPIYVDYGRVVWHVSADGDPFVGIDSDEFESINVLREGAIGVDVGATEPAKYGGVVYSLIETIAQENRLKDALQGMKKLLKRIHDNPPSRLHASYAEYLSYRRTLDMPHITLEQFTEDINEMLRMKYYKDPEPYWTENDLVPGDQFS